MRRDELERMAMLTVELDEWIVEPLIQDIFLFSWHSFILLLLVLLVSVSAVTIITSSE